MVISFGLNSEVSDFLCLMLLCILVLTAAGLEAFLSDATSQINPNLHGIPVLTFSVANDLETPGPPVYKPQARHLPESKGKMKNVPATQEGGTISTWHFLTHVLSML